MINTNAKPLFMAMELSSRNWRLAFGDGKKERQKVIGAGHYMELWQEIKRAKEKFGLADDTPVHSCYEAGRDGFSVHRVLCDKGINNLILDPASIEVARRARHVKTDRLDAERLLKILIRRVLHGEVTVCAVVAVPSIDEEDMMRVSRERKRLVKESTGHCARIRALLTLHGVKYKGNLLNLDVASIKPSYNKTLGKNLSNEIKHEQARLQIVVDQIKEIEENQALQMSQEDSKAMEKVNKLAKINGIGMQTAWLLGHDLFGWRFFKNRKAVGAFAGLTGTPFDSGESRREQGISKAGSGRLRTLLVQVAWGWLRHQPSHPLSIWFKETYAASGTKRIRRKGIVALARKLLVALWKYVEHGDLLEGARLKA